MNSFEKALVTKCRERATEGPSGDREESNVNPKVYCILGHLHLLLEDLPKGRDCTVMAVV